MTASPPPLRAASFDEYAVAFCSAFDSMFRAIGNPDTGEDSPMSADLDAAIEAGDLASVERLAATITAELEVRPSARGGRRRLAAGSAGDGPP